MQLTCNYCTIDVGHGDNSMQAAFMTGRYPFRYGLQKCIPSGSVAAVPLSDRTLPELLKA